MRLLRTPIGEIGLNRYGETNLYRHNVTRCNLAFDSRYIFLTQPLMELFLAPVHKQCIRVSLREVWDISNIDLLVIVIVISDLISHHLTSNA